VERVILHSDMNCFYASVETMLNPALRDLPVAVCGSTEDRHGIVLAKSEMAKKAGVKTGMVNWEATQVCPGLIMVPPQYDQYLKFSKLAHGIYYRYTDKVEPFGMDECWLDVSSLCKTMESGQKIADEIRQTIHLLRQTIDLHLVLTYLRLFSVRWSFKWINLPPLVTDLPTYRLELTPYVRPTYPGGEFYQLLGRNTKLRNPNLISVGDGFGFFVFFSGTERYVRSKVR